MHALRYVCKSTAGNPLQVWLHVCAWWITSWRVCRRVLNDLDFLDRVIGADCVNGCCSLRNAWVLTSHCLSSCLTLNVASKSDRRRRRNHVCVGTGTSTSIWICTTIFSPENKTPSSFSFDAHAHVFERVALRQFQIWWINVKLVGWCKCTFWVLRRDKFWLLFAFRFGDLNVSNVQSLFSSC